jgi:alkaline phosphatase D
MPASLRVLVGLTGLLVAGAAAAEESKPLERIAFGSCAHQDRPQPIWQAIVASKPDLFLFLGDNIYADTTDKEVLAREYARLGALPGFQKIKATCPLLATWDDHDYGLNDSGAENPNRKGSQEVFLDFWGVPKDSPRRKREGVYDARVFGPPGKRVQVILLDTRYFRSPLLKGPKRPSNQGPYIPQTDKTTTILGEEQWKWLARQLEVPAEVRLLVSSIQVIAEDHGFEKWMNFPHERARLFQTIRDSKANGVILLSGDRHLAELSQMDAGVGYPLFDLTSSGLNMANKRWRRLEPNRHRVAIMDVGNNFGMITLNWSHEDPVIGLQTRDEEGDITIQQKVPLSRLRASGVAASPRKGPDLAAEARKQVGKEWTVEFVVRGGGSSAKLGFLNSESDFRSEQNLTVVLDLEKLKADLEAAKISDHRKHFRDRKVRVKGVVELFRDRPQIRVTKLKQIEIVDP